MPDDAGEEPIEILVQMAERGEIDPWNIDIVEVTDRFLSELERREKRDLRISGRTLFYAATLVRMKSEYFGVPDPDSLDDDGLLYDDENPDFSHSFDDPCRGGPIDLLEREISRRLERKHLRKQPVTLFELILLLKDAEKTDRRRRRYLTPQDDVFIEVDDVVSIAHDEGYLDAAVKILGIWETPDLAGEDIALSCLAARLGWTLPDVYIPLLFLMFEGRVHLRQDEIFGELFVRSSAPAE